MRVGNQMNYYFVIWWLERYIFCVLIGIGLCGIRRTTISLAEAENKGDDDAKDDCQDDPLSLSKTIAFLLYSLQGSV